MEIKFTVSDLPSQLSDLTGDKRFIAAEIQELRTELSKALYRGPTDGN